MSYFAEIEDDVVINVIVAEVDIINQLPGIYMETCFGAYGGRVYSTVDADVDALGSLEIPIQYTTVGVFRKNYAGIGYTYDRTRDAFIPHKPFPSWLLNDDTCLWNAPVPMPITDGKQYIWDEATVNWIVIA